jgi:hypothetical protein
MLIGIYSELRIATIILKHMTQGGLQALKGLISAFPLMGEQLQPMKKGPKHAARFFQPPFGN